MNKTELIAAITENTGFTKKDAEKALNSVVDVITDALTKGEKVQIVGFGSFEVKDRPERIARNPQAPDQEITIPASKAPVFKAGKSLKEAVNK
ncbi:MAG: HU family DNA-binding protein [Aristaeellaceae bacterium]